MSTQSDSAAEEELPDEEDAILEEPAPASRQGMTRRLIGGTLNYGIGQALPQFLRFIQVLVFTQVLTEADYGILELASKFSGFLTQFMRLGVPGAVTRFYYDHREGRALTDYVTTIAIFLVGSSLAIGGIVLAVGPWLFARYLPDMAFYPYGLLALGTAVLSCNQNLQDRLVQAREQSRYMAVLNVVRAVLFIALAMLLVLVWRKGAYGMLLAEVIATAIVFLQAGRYLLPNLRGRFDRSMLRSSIHYGLGILPNHFVWNLTNLSTSAILADMAGLAEVGKFGVATKFTLPLIVLAQAFQTAYLPIYFSLRSDHSEKNVATLVRTGRFVWAAALWVSIGGIFFIPPFIRLATPVEFHNSAALVPIMVVGFLGQTVFFLFGPELYYSKKTYLVPITSVVSAIVTLTVTLLTVKSSGAAGVAWANSLGYLASALTAVVLTRRLVSIPYCLADLVRLSVCALVVFAAGWMLTGETIVQGAAVTVATAAAFPVLLWITGDPTVREAAQFVRRRLAMLR
ncbi:MAG TPA: oligosaccharide flippase family protein [Pirellulales bacterium]|nr:oligosaccharide flippase family protein [Pirellulales bacterium]